MRSVQEPLTRESGAGACRTRSQLVSSVLEQDDPEQRVDFGLDSRKQIWRFAICSLRLRLLRQVVNSERVRRWYLCTSSTGRDNP